MKISAGQSEHIKYNFYLNGILVDQFVWEADEEEGYVEVYERSDEPPIFLPFTKSPLYKLVLDKHTGEPKKVILRGIVELKLRAEYK